MNNIAEVLQKRFEDHRIIFWYDTKSELLEQYQEISLIGVEKIHVQSNEFEVKYITHKQRPKDKFLLYFSGPKPAHEDNWLLDMELAHHVFQTDPEAMLIQEMGLDSHFKDLVAEHIEFFKAKDRKTKLKELLVEGDSHKQIRHKMLSVLFGTENISFTTYIHAHTAAYLDGNEKHNRDLKHYNLKDFYWGEIKQQYHYQSDNPSLYDFLLEVFNTHFVLGKKTNLRRDSKLILSLWKDTILYREYFAKVSDKIAVDISVEDKLYQASIDDIIQDDLFRLTDLKIIHELSESISNEHITNEKVLYYVKQRENKFWYNEVANLYQSLIFASELISLIRKYSQVNHNSFEASTQQYADTLFEIDQCYRKFVWYYRRTNQNRILTTIAEKVEKVYTNDWLLTYNNNWQAIIDKLSAWPNEPKSGQKRFFANYVKPIIDKKQRLFVIISDAFRYECGAELTKRLQSENRYHATISHAISSLPSYTQLGMASLLPHSILSIQDNSDIVLADGIVSSGIQGRTKILEKNVGIRATAIKAEEFMKLNTVKEGRDFVKQYDLIYIYHNRIDKVGDDKISEDKVFEAVDDEIHFLIEMLKKITNMNGNNMIVTADHGFMYQHSDLDESDYNESTHSGEIWKENRRFVIGKNLKNDASTKQFKGADLGIASDIDVLIPKSINRLRIKGAGARFIHGGASMQEIIIPVIKITKIRQNTTTQVEVDIIKSTDRITTNILSVSFIQTELVSEQVLPRAIRASIYAEDGELLSDQFRYNFDIQEGTERLREVKHSFQLSAKASNKYKNQRVKLVLEEPLEETSKWKHYKDFYYTLNISFTNDFDDF
ncbi:BREX-1 system phosphatase PglZ type A [Arcicella aquatica]|uniref:BREX-1 system phosphatase PglZ type A n=1 Tax=Arcicella aquatica TaxID=217141 RepID=A0ABU5QQR5_9BACT|nr:BREX-1 system phosphatase PglZ type A [Arcicella aquatica]MEA5259169.1 BREX-1 system phosphatase PglZ type A [Arcicella aquatica]